MADKDSIIVFRHENEDFSLPKEEIVLKKYHRNHGGQKVVDFETKAKHIHVKMLFEFLQRGDVPSCLEDQIPVYELLKEWDCHFSVFDSFRLRVQSLLKNGYVYHQEQMYSVNIGCLFFHSTVFQEFYQENPHGVLIIDSRFSIESVNQFLDLIHNRICAPVFEYLNEVFGISAFLGCSQLCAFIRNSPEYVLSIILDKQQDELFDFSVFEKNICDNIKSFLELPIFGHISLPLLIRVFQKAKDALPMSLLFPFFKNCVSFHGSQAYILLSMIRSQRTNNFEELNQFLGLFSIEHNEDFFSLNSCYFNEFSKQFDKMKLLNLDKDQRIEKLENEFKKVECIVKQLEKKDAESQKKIEELVQKYQKKEEEEYRKLVEEKKKNEELMKQIEFINSKVKEINRIDQRLPYQNGNSFEGFFAWLWKKTGSNPFLNGAASAIQSHSGLGNQQPSFIIDPNFSTSSYIGMNQHSTLTGKYFEFDLKTYHLNLTAYTIQAASQAWTTNAHNLRTWELRASADGTNWVVIDSKRNDSSLNTSLQVVTFEINNSDFYKMFRLVMTGENSSNSYQFAIHRIEFFGNVRTDK